MSKKGNAIIELAEKKIHGSIKDITQVINKGHMNEVYLVKTDRQNVILRVNEPSSFERFKKECWCAEEAALMGVHTPKALEVGIGGEHSFILFDYIEGKNGAEIVQSQDLWYQLGIQLKKIHNISVNGFGEELSDIRSGNFDEWKKYIDYNINSLNKGDQLRKRGVLNDENSAKIQSLLSSLLDKKFNFGLSHGDYSLANVIVDNRSVPNIIDWGCAQAHVVPDYDFGIIIDESVGENTEYFKALLNGYGMTESDYLDIKNEIMVLQLLVALDKLRWAMDKNTKRIEFYVAQVTKFVKKNNSVVRGGVN
jgi:fructosamine-3-kinase